MSTWAELRSFSGHERLVSVLPLELLIVAA